MQVPAEIRCVPETGSTNADLLAALASDRPPQEGAWLVADRQLAGRGRQGRTWLDASGNFMGSTVVALGPHYPPAASLSFVAALAVYEAILARFVRPDRVRLKWPNDVLLDGEKVAGILLERESAHVVVGIGVNLAAAPLVAGQVVRHLSQHGYAPSRDTFAHTLATSFAAELVRWRRFGPAPVLERWLAAAHTPGTPLAVHDGEGASVRGRFAGLEPDGALRLAMPDGSVRIIHAGDVEQERAPCC